MKAEITYNGARSYLVGGVRFLDGVTRIVSDSELIARCKDTAGFSVNVQRERVIREVAAAPKVAAEAESVAKRKVKPARSE